MNFELTDIQKATKQAFQDFVDRHVMPQAAAIDEKKEFPLALFRQAGDLGFFGMRYPEEAGGSSSDIISYCLAVEELARGSLSLAMVCTMQSLMATYFLYRFGDDEIHTNYFKPALAGNKIGGICMTEPEAGSDLMGIKTMAKEKEGHFVLSGQKTWITSATVADFFTVLARTDHNDQLSIFFVPSNLPGVQVGKNIEKLGVRGSPTSEVSFDEVVLPANYLLGELGAGTLLLREILAEIRVMTAALAIGVATAAMDYTIEYARNRNQFGKPISSFQAIKLKFADMAVQLDTARHYMLFAANLCDRGLPRQKESAMAKLYASEAANNICDEASRIMASYGYAMDFPVQRYLRDARFTLIGGGTSEILKINIAKDLGL